MQIPSKKPPQAAPATTPTAAPSPTTAPATSSVSTAAKALEDNFMTRSELTGLQELQAAEQDPAVRSFLETVNTPSSRKLDIVQDDATQGNQNRLLTKLRVSLGLDPQDPVVKGVESDPSAITSGVLAAWTETSPAQDQGAASLKFNQLLDSGAFLDAAVSAAHLQPAGRLDALTALAKRAGTEDDLAVVRRLLLGGHSLTYPERTGVLEQLIANPKASGDLVQALINHALPMEDAHVLRSRLLLQVLERRPTDEGARTGAYGAISAGTEHIHEPGSLVRQIATRLLETGAPVLLVLNAFVGGRHSSEAPTDQENIDKTVASLITDVLPKIPKGLEDAREVMLARVSWPGGRRVEDAAIKMGIIHTELPVKNTW